MRPEIMPSMNLAASLQSVENLSGMVSPNTLYIPLFGIEG